MPLGGPANCDASGGRAREAFTGFGGDLEGPGTLWRGRKWEPGMQSSTEIRNPGWVRSKNRVPPCLAGDTHFQGHPRFSDMQTQQVADGVPTAAQPTREPRVFAPTFPGMDGGARWGWALRCPGRLWGRGSVARP